METEEAIGGGPRRLGMLAQDGFLADVLQTSERRLLIEIRALGETALYGEPVITAEMPAGPGGGDLRYLEPKINELLAVAAIGRKGAGGR